MKIEFDTKEVEALLIARAKEIGLTNANTVEMKGRYDFAGAIVSYVDPVAAAEEKQRRDEAIAQYRTTIEAAAA